MEKSERVLFHQIHPFKLCVDWLTAFFSLYEFWIHQILIGLVIGFIPSIITSFVLVQYANLEKIKTSRFGVYISKNMTRFIEIIRMFGYLMAVTGAWVHSLFLIILGFLIILLGWLRGLILPNVT